MDAVQQTDLGSGTTVDHFKLVRLVGRGGMGEVYLARDTKLGRKVALKLIRPESLGNEQAVRRFLHEARTTAKFSHPHIVQVHAVGEHDARPYVALEYLEGDTLRERMDQRRLSPKETIRIGLAIAEALAEAHKHGVLHRDLKPENVVIPPNGRLRVVDFGLAKHIGEGETLGTADMTDVTLAETFKSKGGLMGTPLYMAPEQWGEEDVTSAIDMWALGVMLYELLSGQHPYEEYARGRKLFVLAARVCSDAPVPDLTAGPVPAKLHELTTRALAKEPEERPSAADAVETLAALVQGGRSRHHEDQSPFRGLMPFTEEHADLFFGRDAEVDQFLERLRHEPVLPVVGPSGAGKSSFVQAGVIPRLLEQDHWLILRMRPGRKPFETLASRLVQGCTTGSGRRSGPRSRRSVAPSSRGAEQQQEGLRFQLEESPALLGLELARLAEESGAPVLLFVDQLEELHTLVPDPDTRLAFMEAICSAADDAYGPVRVVFTVRDDFLARLARGAAAREALSHVTVLRSPGAEALEDILTKPLAVVGYRYDEPSMVEEMARAVQDEPAGLPLLQFVGQALWEQRDVERKRLLRSAYDQMGGVAGALAGQADALLAGLTEEQVGFARNLLLRLVTAEGTRRSVARPELLDGLEEGATEVLDRLVSERAVVARRAGRRDGEGELELVHESLVRNWKRLARWLSESRDDVAFADEIRQAAELWSKRGRPEDEVWKGPALQAALVKSSRLPSVPATVQAFLDAGAQHGKRRQRQRRVLIGSAMAFLTALAIAAALTALAYRDQRVEAVRGKREAEKERAAAIREGAEAALARGGVLEARAKLRMALSAIDGIHARALWGRLRRQPAVWTQPGQTFWDLAWSPDGRFIVEAARGPMHVVDARTGQKLSGGGPLPEGLSPFWEVADDEELMAYQVAFAPAGSTLFVGARERVLVLDTQAPGQHRSLRSPAGPLAGRLSVDGTSKKLSAPTEGGEVLIWNLASDEVERRLRVGPGASAALGPRGERLLTAGAALEATVWNLDSGEVEHRLEGHRERIAAVAVHPRELIGATAGVDGVVLLWDLARGTMTRELREPDGPVRVIAFSPDGKLLATGSSEGSVRVWETSSGREHLHQRLGDRPVRAISFSADGRFVSALDTARVRTFHLGANRGPGGAGGFTDEVIRAIAVVPKHELVAAGSWGEGEVRLFDLASGRPRQILRGHAGGIRQLAAAEDGSCLLSASTDGTVRVWELPVGRLRSTLRGHTGEVTGVAITPDGAWAASASLDGTVRIWDLAAGEQRRALRGHQGAVFSVAISAAGDTLASGGQDGTVRLWSLPTGAERTTWSGHKGAVRSLAFDPTGAMLASGATDRDVRLWDVDEGSSRVFKATESITRVPLSTVRFSPDGRRLAAAIGDSTYRVWDVATGQEQAKLRDGYSSAFALDFVPHRALLAHGEGASVTVWDLAADRPLWHASTIVASPPRAFTHRGWIALDDAGSASESPLPTRCRQAVEKHGRNGARGAKPAPLCLLTYDDELQIWDCAEDEQVRSVKLDATACIWSVPTGCVTTSQRGVELHETNGASKQLDKTPEMVSVAADRLFVLRPGAVAEFDFRGKAGPVTAISSAALAATATEQGLAVGFFAGQIQLLAPTATSAGAEAHRWLETRARRPVFLEPGPRLTLAAAFNNGTIGVWDTETGTWLDGAKADGLPIHTLRNGDQLHVVTSKGDTATVDLSVYRRPYCEILREVWQQVPVVWKDGRAVVEPPPDDHECAPK